MIKTKDGSLIQVVYVHAARCIDIEIWYAGSNSKIPNAIYSLSIEAAKELIEELTVLIP